MCDCGEELDRRNRERRSRGPGGVGGGGNNSGNGGGARYAGGRGGGASYAGGRGGGASYAGGNGGAVQGAGGNHGGPNDGTPGVGKPGTGGRNRDRNVGGQAGGGGSNKMEYWTNIIGGTTILMGLFTLLYKTFDLGTLWRNKLNGIWGGVLDSMCHNYVKDPCGGLRIKDYRRKWTDVKPQEMPPGEHSPSEPCQATIIIELEDDD